MIINIIMGVLAISFAFYCISTWGIIKGAIIVGVTIFFVKDIIKVFIPLIIGGSVVTLRNIWDKEHHLSWKDGFIVGVFYAVLMLLVAVYNYFFASIFTGVSDFLVYINTILIIGGCLITVLALIRLKFKFAISFLISSIITYTICLYINFWARKIFWYIMA